MTLRSRLLLALLLLAVLPTGILTLFTLDQLERAMGRWYRPGVDRALEDALEITKGSLTRLESMVRIQAGEWAGRWSTAAADTGSAARVRASGLDFVQAYRRIEGRWRPAGQVVAAGVLVPHEIDLGAEIDAALAADQLIRGRAGALAGVAPLPGGGALVAGITVDRDLFADVERVALGSTHYRRLGVYVDVERRIVLVLVAGVVVALAAVAFVLASRLARGTAQPIAEMSGALERVAGGDLETRVTPRGAVELRSLGESFNAMTARLQAAREALQQAEREAAWRDVARKLAHEFKNLLTPMKLSLQLLGDQIRGLDPRGREQAEKSLSAALREVGHLDRLAEQFSQYARLPEPRFEPLDLADVTRSAAALLPGARIELAGAAGPVTVRGDRLLLSRAIHNLLINACEAGPPGGPVEVRVERRAREGRIEILDSGPGLPPGLEGRLFEPYVSTKKRGSGLGLSLVRDIVRQHGGALTLENRPDGPGALARVSLPAADGTEG